MVKNPPSKAGDYTGNYMANSIFIRKCKAGSTPGLERSPEEEMVAHCSILAWEIPWIQEPSELQSIGSQKSWT